MAKFIIWKKKLLLLGFLFLVFLLGSSFSKAEVIYLTDDTMKVGGGFYADDSVCVIPGQSGVAVTVYLRNTFDVAGFNLRLVYDSTVMYPRPPVPDSSFDQLPRSWSLPIFMGNFNQTGEVIFLGAPFFNPDTERVFTGNGPIVEFYFNIKSSAPKGNYPIKLEEDTLDISPFDNTLGDTLGLNIYIPVLENGVISVCSCYPFIRGDTNGDCLISVSDLVFLINYLFKGGTPPDPIEAGDADCDGQVTVSDIIYLFSYLFKGGPAPRC
jgi:hypothetical protein